MTSLIYGILPAPMVFNAIQQIRLFRHRITMVTPSMRAIAYRALLSIGLLLGAGIVLRAQDDAQGPIAPPPKLEVKRVPSVPHPGPPPIPEQEIIQRFAANEDVMKKAFDTYTFTKTIRYEEMTDPGGMVSASGETYFKPDGQRYWGVANAPRPTLKLTQYSLQDVIAMSSVPLFFLTSADIAKYNFLYAGQQQLDELNTYVFQVKPKLLSRKERLFDGVVWVDDHDFAIVRSWGKFVLDVEPEGNHLPFTMFETYRENFQDKYWLPTYTSSEDEVAIQDGSKIPVQLIVRATKFKPRSDASAVSSASPQTSPPAPSSQ